MIRRLLGTAVGFVVGAGVVLSYVATADADPEPPPEYDPPLVEQCRAVLEDPEGLAEWLADRNGITIAKARATVAKAITNVCADL